MSVIRTRISGFRSHGINFAQRAYDRAVGGAARARARQRDQRHRRSRRRRPAPTRAASGPAACRRRSSATGSTTPAGTGSRRSAPRARVTVVGNEIARTRIGIYLEHETNDSLFARNVDRRRRDRHQRRVALRRRRLERQHVRARTRSCDRPRRACSSTWQGDRNRIAGNIVRGRHRPGGRAAGRLRQPRRPATARAGAPGQPLVVAAERAPRRRPGGALAPQPHRRPTRAWTRVR